MESFIPAFPGRVYVIGFLPSYETHLEHFKKIVGDLLIFVLLERTVLGSLTWSYVHFVAD